MMNVRRVPNMIVMKPRDFCCLYYNLYREQLTG